MARCIFYPQGRAVQTAKSLDEGLGAVIELQTPDIVFDSNNNKLVHTSGPLRTEWVSCIFAFPCLNASICI